MGLLDKIKNALFEVEYVEVEEDTPKKEKKEKKPKEDKPIAKKIVLPGKKEEKVEELHEEELRDEDFEIRPKEEVIHETPHEEFKYMDDNDFKVDEHDYLEEVEEEPQVLHVVEPEEEPVVEETKPYSGGEERDADYYTKAYAPSRESKPYGLDQTYQVPVHEYGTYEKREEKIGFRPSPIISPIYGILDKNYKKEDVKERKEVRLSSSYSRSGINVDDIRNKAYGETKRIERRTEVENPISVEEEKPKEEENVMVDLSDAAKPEVKEITVGDAVEYFQDLGLEYNVDYVDASKEKTPKKEVKEEIKEEPVVKEEPEVMEEQPKEEEKKTPEKKKLNKESVEDNDNLFDLIDSMYQEND